LAELFQCTYRNSSHPFQTFEGVSAFLSDSRNYQIIAEDNGRIISSMAMTYYPWNSSYELGRALTDPEYRGSGLAATLMQRVVGWVSNAALGEVFFGYPRVRRIVDLCSELEPPMVIVGHDAGRNVANGSRETHMIVVSIPAQAKFDHVGPPCSGGSSCCAAVRLPTYERLRLRWRPGQYPSRLFVGAMTDNVIQSGEFLIDYDPDNPNHSIELLSCRSTLASPAQVCSRLESCLHSFPEAQHVTATVLADKIELLEDLQEIGFRVTAYLPAWYGVGHARFDCVQLSRISYAEPVAKHDLGDLIADFGRETSCHGPLQLSPRLPEDRNDFNKRADSSQYFRRRTCQAA
jgi:hypothetical protein